MEKQSTLDSVTYVNNGVFPSIWAFERAKKVYEEIIDKGCFKTGDNVYTRNRVGTLLPNKVTRSFRDFLTIECDVSKVNLEQAELAIIRAPRTKYSQSC